MIQRGEKLESAAFLPGIQTCWDSNVAPYIKNASFSACSLAANISSDKTGWVFLKKGKGCNSYQFQSCPIMVHMLQIFILERKEKKRKEKY